MTYLTLRDVTAWQGPLGAPFVATTWIRCACGCLMKQYVPMPSKLATARQTSCCNTRIPFHATVALQISLTSCPHTKCSSLLVIEWTAPRTTQQNQLSHTKQATTVLKLSICSVVWHPRFTCSCRYAMIKWNRPNTEDVHQQCLSCSKWIWHYMTCLKNEKQGHGHYRSLLGN